MEIKHVTTSFAWTTKLVYSRIQCLWTTNTLLDNKHDEQRSLCAPRIATYLDPLRTTGSSYVDRISSKTKVVAKVSCTIWVLILAHARQLFMKLKNFHNQVKEWTKQLCVAPTLPCDRAPIEPCWTLKKEKQLNVSRVRHFFVGQSTSMANVSMTWTSFGESRLQFIGITLSSNDPQTPTSRTPINGTPHSPKASVSNPNNSENPSSILVITPK